MTIFYLLFQCSTFPQVIKMLASSFFHITRYFQDLDSQDEADRGKRKIEGAVELTYGAKNAILGLFFNVSIYFIYLAIKNIYYKQVMSFLYKTALTFVKLEIYFIAYFKNNTKKFVQKLTPKKFPQR